jgi:SAM-dependent methyltransferase
MTQPSWSGGYVADTLYVTGWHDGQAPAGAALALALAGIRCDLPRETMTVVDVGCGRGYTALALAAANPGWTVIGIDYHPAHIAEAREIAAEVGLPNARFLELDLAALTEAEALRTIGEADYVTLHGLWTWVADPVRDGVLALLRGCLKPGGVATVSYNALPGWSDGLGVQRLLRSVAMATPGPSDARAAAAMETLRQLEKSDAFYLKRSAAVARLLHAGIERNLAYVAHEFLTEHWRPAFATDVHSAMAGAKLDPCASADLVENIPALTLTPEQRAAVGRLAGEAREIALDLCLRRSFRQDIFVRGRRPAEPGALMQTRLALLAAPEALQPRVETPLGEATLPEAVLRPVLEALGQGPRSLAELLSLPGCERTTPGELLAVLVAGGSAKPVWRDPAAVDPTPSRRFNLAAARRYQGEQRAAGARLAAAVPALASGFPCTATELGVIALLQIGAAPAEPAALARAMLAPGAPAPAVAEAEDVIGRMLRERMAAWRILGMVQG